MPRKTANFRVGKTADFGNGTQAAIFKETKAPICNKRSRQFRSVTKKNINETEKPLHKTTYFNFCGKVFS